MNFTLFESKVNSVKVVFKVVLCNFTDVSVAGHHFGYTENLLKKTVDLSSSAFSLHWTSNNKIFSWLMHLHEHGKSLK